MMEHLIIITESFSVVVGMLVALVWTIQLANQNPEVAPLEVKFSLLSTQEHQSKISYAIISIFFNWKQSSPN